MAFRELTIHKKAALKYWSKVVYLRKERAGIEAVPSF
jgi:hypothetical protein